MERMVFLEDVESSIRTIELIEWDAYAYDLDRPEYDMD
jgi:hypothetical protein